MSYAHTIQELEGTLVEVMRVYSRKLSTSFLEIVYWELIYRNCAVTHRGRDVFEIVKYFAVIVVNRTLILKYTCEIGKRLCSVSSVNFNDPLPEPWNMFHCF